MVKQNEISALIVDRCIHIHKTLGPGLFESVYKEVLAYELSKSSLKYRRQTAVPVRYEQMILDLGFRPDFIVEETVIVELKSVEALAPVHFKQVLTYLKLTNIELGLLINFNEELLKNGIRRIINTIRR